MSRPVIGESERTHDVPDSRLWFGLLGGPAAWIVQGSLGWLFGYRVCTQMSVGSVRVVLAVISVAAIGVTLAALLVGWRNWQEASGAVGLDAGDRVAFMSLGGILVSAAFLAGTIWAGLTPVIVSGCGGMR